MLPIRRLTAEESQSSSKARAAALGDLNSKSPQRTLRKFADITDGLGHTILAGEVSTRLKPWGHPANLRDPALGVGQSPEGFAGPPGTNTTLLLMCDGSVRAVSNNIDRKVIAAMGTPAGGETIPSEEH